MKHTTRIADGVAYKKKRKIIGIDVKISYGIIMCNTLTKENGETELEYILEKESGAE